MKFGETLTFTVDRLDHKGRGCGKLSDAARFGAEGRTVCAAGTIPGETVRGSFVGKAQGVFRAEVEEIVSSSPDRVAAPCPHAGRCGGCAMQHMRYERQVTLKLEGLNRALRYRHIDLIVNDLVLAKDIFRYRNRMDYVFGPNGELGLKEAGRWDRYVDLSTCLLLSEDAMQILTRTKAWAAAHGFRGWNAKMHAGDLRYLVIREGKATGERMAMLVTSLPELPHAEAWIEAVQPFVTSLYHGVNTLPTDLSLAESLQLLHGQPLLHETVGGITYAIHPNSFFQTNTVMAGRLLEHVSALVREGAHARVLDMYSGSGFFALALARHAEHVLGIELDAEAIAAARANAEANGIANAVFRAEAAEALSWETEKPDVVILDPPRSGLHPKVIRTLLAKRPPRIVYVSCSPIALARDLEMLSSAFAVRSARAFDLFPHTPHVETVLHLEARPL